MTEGRQEQGKRAEAERTAGAAPERDEARDVLAPLAALAEPLRRRLYRHVARRSGAVSRDDAAAALGVPRSVAAFHLDKLADLGLLEVEYRRPPGRGGPGAGRPSKLYRRAGRDIELSVPERHYDLAASLLARAVDQAGGRPVTDAVRDVAREHGRNLSAPWRPAGRASRRPLDRLAAVLSSQGYEPRVESGTMVLDNCPFRRLAEQHRDVVCGMNLALVEGVLASLGIPESDARLEPDPGRCCVKVTASS